MRCSEDNWTDFFNIFLMSFRTIEGNVLDLKVVSNSVPDSVQTSELEVLQCQINELNDEVWAPFKVCLFQCLKYALEGKASPSIKRTISGSERFKISAYKCPCTISLEAG